MITVRPGALEAFGERMMMRWAELEEGRTTLEELRGVYEHANPDYTERTLTMLKEETTTLQSLRDRATFALRFAAAVRELDRTAAVGLPGLAVEPGVSRVPEGAVMDVAATVGEWSGLEDLRSRMVPMSAQEWSELVYGADAPVSQPYGWYRGSGGILGPDGRTYPMVIPEVPTSDGVMGGNYPNLDADMDVTTLGGEDAGWVLVLDQQGEAKVADGLEGALKWVTLAGIATNPDLAPPGAADREALKHLDLLPGGWPVGSSPEATGPATPPPVPGELGLDREEVLVPTKDGKVRRVDPAAPHNREVRRSNDQKGITPDPKRARYVGAAAAFDLAVGGAVAVAAKGDIENAPVAAYQVRFEQHPDGRRRATVRVVTAQSVAQGGQPTVHAVAMGEDRRLELSPIEFRPPPDGVMGSSELDGS